MPHTHSVEGTPEKADVNFQIILILDVACLGDSVQWYDGVNTIEIIIPVF